MILIPLVAVPNQSFQFSADSNFWDININVVKNVMASTVSLNSNILQSGVRLMPNQLILPYHYEENGNFILMTMNDDYPIYSQFQITQILVYLSPVDLISLRVS